MPILVPDFVAEALSSGRNTVTVTGTCLQLDTSGFSAELEDYIESSAGTDERGARAAGSVGPGEHARIAEISAILDAHFAGAITEIHKHGGVLAQIDASECVAIFPEDESSVAAAIRAARAISGRRVQATGHGEALGSASSVTRGGLSHGDVTWEHVGPSYHMAAALYGDSLRLAAAQCHAAELGALQQEDAVISMLMGPSDPAAAASVEKLPLDGSVRQYGHAAVCLIRVDAPEDLRSWAPQILTLSAEMDGFFHGFDFARQPGIARVLFGMPKAIEHPEKRATDFAVTLRDRVPADLRAAVTAGPVYGASHGAAGLEAFLIVGMATRRSQVLLAADYGGSIMVSPELHSSIKDSYALQPRGRGRLPGYRKTVEVAEVLWREQVERPGNSLFVGRDKEHAVLREYLAGDTKAAEYGEQQPKAAFVTGPPGMGKSTLVRAALSDLSAASVLSVRGTDRLLPGFWCLAEALQEYWNLPLKDDPRFSAIVTERFDATELRTADEELRETLQRLRPFVEYSLGLGRPIVLSLDPETRHRNIHEGWIALLRALPAVRVLWVDDLQWLDAAGRDVLEAWITRYARPGMRIVLCARSSGEPLSSDTVVGRPPLLIDLPPLSPEASAELLHRRGVDRLVGPDGTELLVERSVGSPFFLEQSVRYLEEHFGAGDEAGALRSLPDRVESVILARVERLSARVREAVQRAAILGFRFDIRVLSAMLRDEALTESMEPDGDEELSLATTELSALFSHSLIPEAVYQSQLGSQQQALHAAAAAAYEQVYSGPARRSRLYEIADHYERAGARDRAVSCLAEAAEYALEDYENERALALLRRRLELTGTEDLGALHDLAKALIRVGAWEEAAELLQRVVARFESAPEESDPREVVDCLVVLSDLQVDQGATESAAALTDRGISIAEQHDYHGGLAYLYRNRGLIAYRREEMDAALRAYEAGLSYARRYGDERAIARVYNDMAIVLAKIGRHEEALQAFRANLELARRLNEFAGISAALNNIGFLYNEMDRPKDAMRYFREDLELCRAAGNRQGRSVALGNMADILSALDSREEALGRFREAIAIDRQIGFLPHESYMHQQLGRVLLDLGHADEGCRELREAKNIAEDIQFPMVRDKVQELLAACEGCDGCDG